MSFEELAKLANMLGGAGFATLLFIILVGSYKDIWCWSRDRRAIETRDDAEKQELLDRMEAEVRLANEQVEFWRHIALRNTGLLETQTEQLLQVASQVGAVNRKLLDKP
jgi:hypothetical protein